MVAQLPATEAVGELLSRLAAAPPRLRDDLVGQSNLAGGSGGQFGRFAEIGREFLKTSLKRRYATAVEGLSRELTEERLRQRLGIYHPRRSWFLSRGGDGAHWACSLTPTLESLRTRFSRQSGHDECWNLYLIAFRMTFDLARREGLSLDCNPNNFGVEAGGVGGRLYYIDDDLMRGQQPATFGTQALLRLREYGRAGLGVRRRFLSGFVRLTESYGRQELRRWGLLADLESPILWPPEPELRDLLEQLVERLHSTRRRRRRRQ